MSRTAIARLIPNDNHPNSQRVRDAPADTDQPRTNDHPSRNQTLLDTPPRIRSVVWRMAGRRCRNDLIERARGLSAERDLGGALEDKKFRNQYADGFQVLHPRPNAGRARLYRPVHAGTLRPGQRGRGPRRKRAAFRGSATKPPLTCCSRVNVLVVDLFGKKVDGTIVGDNLFYYVMKANPGGGLVVDGSVRDLDGISEIDMPAYFRSVDPTPIGNVMLHRNQYSDPDRRSHSHAGRLGRRRSGRSVFHSAASREGCPRPGDETHIHDEWTKKKFDEGKYKSSEIYGSPSDPKLKQEYQEYLRKRLEEIGVNGSC